MERECDQHRGQVWVRCSMCRADALGDGDRDALTAWAAREQTAECDARFPPRYRDAAADHPEVLSWLETWHADPSRCPSLLLAGPVGVGKTWQAYGAVRAAVTGPQSTRWIAVTSADLYASLRPQPKTDTEAVMSGYRGIGLLMVDDLGAAKPSEWVEEITYRVIGGRYDAMLPAVYTTNVPTGRLKQVLGDRIASRLAETCQITVLEGSDRRRAAA